MFYLQVMIVVFTCMHSCDGEETESYALFHFIDSGNFKFKQVAHFGI
jgi:hypothetical protein